MGFKETRKALIEALEDGRFSHETRVSVESKNLLFMDEVTPEFVIELLKRCRGDQYSTSKHHRKPSQIVDIFRVNFGGRSWYIKSFFIEQDGVLAIFISVHY